MGKLDGKVAIISGGARGQGAAEVRLFTLEAAKVVFGDVLDEEGLKVESEVQEQGGDASYLHLEGPRSGTPRRHRRSLRRSQPATVPHPLHGQPAHSGPQARPALGGHHGPHHLPATLPR